MGFIHKQESVDDSQNTGNRQCPVRHLVVGIFPMMLLAACLKVTHSVVLVLVLLLPLLLLLFLQILDEIYSLLHL